MTRDMTPDERKAFRERCSPGGSTYEELARHDPEPVAGTSADLGAVLASVRAWLDNGRADPVVVPREVLAGLVDALAEAHELVNDHAAEIYRLENFLASHNLYSASRPENADV